MMRISFVNSKFSNPNFNIMMLNQITKISISYKLET